MTHDPIPKKALSEGLYRLWCRHPENPSHWVMLAVGTLDDIEQCHCDLGIHQPHEERLILPAAERPCGPAAKCDLCWRRAEHKGYTVEGNKLVLLCPVCLDRANR